MCDPFTIAGIALTAGSTVANYAANKKIEAARNDALGAERVRQGALDQEADAINTMSQDRYQGVEGQMGTEATKLGDYLSSQGAPQPESGDALPSAGSSNITVQEADKQKAKAKAETDASAVSLGNLRSFGDVLGGISRSQARDAGRVAQIGGFKTGSANILPFELDEASKAGNKLKLLADVLGGVGSVGMSAGISGATPASLFGGKAAAGGVPVTSAVRGATNRPLRLGGLYGGGR